jgi:Tol biopolymer transport system component
MTDPRRRLKRLAFGLLDLVLARFTGRVAVRVPLAAVLVDGEPVSYSTLGEWPVKHRPVMALVLLACLLVVPASLAPTASAATGATTRVSVASGGTQANNISHASAISADGRYVAFQSLASNLVAGDTNGVRDVFVHDQVTGVTTRISVASGGTQANGESGASGVPYVTTAISADGRYVAFQSLASNLVAGDTNGVQDVFVHDRVTGDTTRVSVDSSGTQATGVSWSSAISADGRYVAFYSPASNLVAGDTNGMSDVFVHDRVTGDTTRVSVASSGTQADDYSGSPAISADGRYVAFASSASNLVAGGDTALLSQDIFIHDRVSGATTRVSVGTGGTQANNISQAPKISADGRYVAFYSAASNLVAGDTNARTDVFVRDRVTGVTTRVSVATSGAQANGSSYVCGISGDGRYVAFYSAASNLVAGDTNGTYDVFVRDRVTGATTRVSVAPSGAQSNGSSSVPAISGDGRYVVFESAASNLVAGDTNAKTDVFVRDRLQATAAVTRLSDFNRDGATDLVARDAAGRLWLYPGNGAGGFKGRRQIGVGWNSVTAIITPGDITGDGNADVLARDSVGRLWLYPGNGSSGFSTRRQIGSGWGPFTITNAANLNSTGRPDLLARDTAGALWLYPVSGNAVFGARTKVGAGWNPYTILGPGDVSGDTRADILARDTAGSLWLYRGTGTGRVGGRTLVSSGWAAMTALVTPGNWDRTAGNDVLARDAAGVLWLYPGNNNGGLGMRSQIGSGWSSFTYIG